MICNTSRKVRDHIHDHIRAMAETKEAASAERAARRQVTVSKRTQDWRIVDTAEKFARRVIRHPGEYTVGKLRSAASEAQREVFDEALDHAIAEDWIEERTEDGQGTPKQRLHPGGTRP